MVVMVEAPMREAWMAGVARIEDRDDRAADAAADAGHSDVAAAAHRASDESAAAKTAAAATETATTEAAGVGGLRGKHRHRERSRRSESEDRFA
jgi:hypothetical protein